MYKVNLSKIANISAVRETLRRIGVGDMKRRILYQSCYLVELDFPEANKKGWYLTHFKELYALLPNKFVDMLEEDYQRLNVIAMFLKNWDLCEIEDESYKDIDLEGAPFVTVIKHHDKDDWVIVEKISLRELEKNKHILNCWWNIKKNKMESQ